MVTIGLRQTASMADVLVRVNGAHQDKHKKDQKHLRKHPAILYTFFSGNGALFVRMWRGISRPRAQGFQPFSLIVWCDHLDSRSQRDSKFVVFDIMRYPEPMPCPVKYINKPSLRLQFQSCRLSTLLFSDLGLGYNRLNRLNLVLLS